MSRLDGISIPGRCVSWKASVSDAVCAKRGNRRRVILGALSLFAMLAVCNGIMHGGGDDDDDSAYSLQAPPLDFSAAPIFDTSDSYFVQATAAPPGLPSLAFAAQGGDIATVADIQSGDGFEVGGSWDVAVYEDERGNIYAVVLARIADAVQIIDITDPASPSVISTLRDGDDLALDDPVGIAVYDDGASVYAMVTTHNSNTFQIIDITDPASPSAVATLLDGSEFALEGPLGFAVYDDRSGHAYAVVAAHFGDAVQIIDITDPASPSAVAAIRNGGDFALDGPGDVAVYDDGASVYAIVAVYDTDAVQIIDITDPASPSAVSTLWNEGDFALDKPWAVVVHENADAAYAIFMARMGNTVQVLDITDPASPSVAATLMTDGGFEVEGPVSFEIYEDNNNNNSNNGTYALLTALDGDTLQIIDITDPANPLAVATFRGGGDFELGGPTGVAIYEDGNNGTYAVITGFANNMVKIVRVDTSMPPSSDAGTSNGDASQMQAEQGAGDEEKRPEGGGCLIATAAYGTELAPQIQTLREVRNNIVLDTESGSAFMQAFHHVYYSFSPAVADMQRQNDAFNAAVRTLISPMVATLSIMTLADSDSEHAVMGLGVLVVSLNLCLYAGLPVLAGILIRRHVVAAKAIRPFFKTNTPKIIQRAVRPGMQGNPA